MGEKQSRKKVLKIISRINASAFDMQDFAIQVRASSLGELLEDAAKRNETIIYTDNNELARLLWERIGNADVAETPPIIGEEFFFTIFFSPCLSLLTFSSTFTVSGHVSTVSSIRPTCPYNRPRKLHSM
jgi:hypothetical protein